jgi:hypothetical protein
MTEINSNSDSIENAHMAATPMASSIGEDARFKTEQALNGSAFTKLYGHCFEMKSIEENTLVPVGGENVFTQESNIEVIADIPAFENFYAEVDKLAATYNFSSLKQWMDTNGIKIDVQTLALLFAFTRKFKETFPDCSKQAQNRLELYKSKSNIKLSDVFSEKAAECAEIAALTQGFLQSRNISSSYFSGDVLWKKEREFSDAHSFIVIREKGNVFFYDPSNPTQTQNGLHPSVYATDADFDAEMAKNQKRFVVATNMINKTEICLGINDGTNVWPEKHFA